MYAICRIPGRAGSYKLSRVAAPDGAWGVVNMYTTIEQRACDLAEYIIENKSTVRAAARQFSISKSTVHKDLTERLPRLNPALFRQVRQLLDLNKAERHIRGGMATKLKYKRE